ncbi:hypothetical protein DFA_08566 [Cavenderia fasciculata]|uniref:Uncharacterized protein n=1 Tax=Cavenderia fasciculata TaxID=261658 RepID=F4Q306_CACFS|nr:uncharacterized protein DFA_08566 [Cavenderia fasciculata]EGG17570.1 hypothetical protein DFA_08566 [Cavenderia fasciculata]|eukprot:XP_004356054.1 hypothetical protein DFA_08566 [Cavenderia fasciculata]
MEDRERSRTDRSTNESNTTTTTTAVVTPTKNAIRGFISDISDKLIGAKKDDLISSPSPNIMSPPTTINTTSTTPSPTTTTNSLSLSSSLITPISPPPNPSPSTAPPIDSRIQAIEKQTKLPRPSISERSKSYARLDEILQNINVSAVETDTEDPNTFNSLISEEESFKSEGYSALSRNELLRVQNERLKSENIDLKKQLNIIIHDNGEQHENTLYLKSVIQEQDEFTMKQDSVVQELKAGYVSTLEKLINDETKFQEDKEKLLNENQSLRDTIDILDINVIDLTRELRKQKDYSIEAVVHRLKNGITPSGIERLKSIQEKEKLMEQVAKLYSLDFNDDPLFQVIIYFRNILSWKLFIKMLRNNYDALEYYTSYCKKYEKFEDLINIYKTIRNPLEEGLSMVKQATTEYKHDTTSQMMILEETSKFFSSFQHLSFYQESLCIYLNSLKNGVNLSVLSHFNQ